MNFDDTNLHCIVKDVSINKSLAIGNCAAVDGWVSTEKLFIPRCQWLRLKTEQAFGSPVLHTGWGASPTQRF